MSKSKTKTKICQSCGMPINKDPKRGGTVGNGTKTTKYCSYCFQNGQFTIKTRDVKVFQDTVRQSMINNGSNRLVAWLFTRSIARLDRWKKKK